MSEALFVLADAIKVVARKTGRKLNVLIGVDEWSHARVESIQQHNTQVE